MATGAMASPVKSSSHADMTTIDVFSAPSQDASMAALGSPLQLRSTAAPSSSNTPTSPSKRASVQDLSGAKGAEGGAEAIALRRRGSNSFKTMSTGGLVSNSPFTKRLGQAAGASANGRILDRSPSPEATRTLYSPSRIPTSIATGSPLSGSPVRKNSGSRKVSGGNESPSNENVMPRQTSMERLRGQETASVSKSSSLPRSRSTSPSVPFRPVRPPTSTKVRQDTQSQAQAAATTSSGLYKPAKSVTAEPPRRETASFAALRKGNAVSSSPFVQALSRNQHATEKTSPPLPSAPYEIAQIGHESAPFAAWTHDAETEDVDRPLSPKISATSEFARRPAAANGGPIDRRIAGSSVPPPNTPPHTRTLYTASSPSPVSAMSPQRRGIKGPRALDSSTPDGRDSGNTLRRQPSGKTVTWAATEEVLEFEVEDRRTSGVSLASSDSGDGGRYYARDDSSDEGNASMGFKEGGSVEVHDIDTSDEDSAHLAEDDHDDDGDDLSQVSTASSQVEDMIGAIDNFMLGDSYDDVEIFSPSQIDGKFSPSLAQSSPFDEAPHATDQSTSGASSTSQTGSSDNGGDTTSVSSYDGEENEDTTAKIDDIVPGDAHRYSDAASFTAIRQDLPDQSSPSHDEPPIEPTLVADGSAYSLPDIQETSPFMPFEDDGAADSVVSLYMERNTQPLAPRRTASQLSSVSAEAPPHLVGLFGSQPIQQVQQLSPHLSRAGSIVSERASTVSASDASSWFGSISSTSGGNGSLFMSRDRLQQKMKEHQALLGGNAGSTLDIQSQGMDHGRFPSDLAPPVLAPRSSREVIHAKPAQRATTATLSTNMLPTIIGHSLELGTPLTEQMAAEMASPLDRLQRGVEEKREGEGGWSSGDSLLGVGSSELAPKAGERLRADVAEPRQRASGTRRRSSSTSDAPIAETTSIHEEPKYRLPEHGFEHHLDAVLPGKNNGFGLTVEADLDDIFKSRDRSYRIHERRNVVYAADAVRAAGDVDPGRAWRKKRPSNMHEVNRSLSLKSVTAAAGQRKPKNLSGQLFVILREAVFENLPLPQEKTSLKITLDNGKQKVEAGSRLLEKTVLIRSEFELVSSDTLEFDVTFHAPPKKYTPAPVLTPPPPPSPSKSPRGLRALLSSPKKKRAAEAASIRASTPVPQAEPVFDPFYDFVANNGELASVHFVFADEAPKCRLKRHRVNIPLEFKGMRKIARGALSMDLLYVPAIPGVPRNQLAISMEDAVKGMELAEYDSKVTHEGVLTQLGGDCSIWRRRNFKLRSNRLVPYNEITKMSFVEIDLSLVQEIEDLNKPTVRALPGSPATRRFADDEEAMDHSFRLVFKDGSNIDLFADDDGAKAKWMEVLQKLLDSPAAKRKAAPVWALALRKLVAAGKA